MISNLENENGLPISHDVSTFFTALQYRHKDHKLKLDARVLDKPFKDLPDNEGDYSYKHLVAWKPKLEHQGVTLYDTSYSTPKFFCYIGAVSNRAAGPLFYYYDPKSLNSKSTRGLPYNLQYSKTSTNLSKIVGDIVKGCEGTSVETLLQDTRNRTCTLLHEWVNAPMHKHSMRSPWIHHQHVDADLRAILAANIVPQSEYLRELLAIADDIAEYHRRLYMLPFVCVFRDDSRCAYLRGELAHNNQRPHQQTHPLNHKVVIKDSLDDMPESIQVKIAMLSIAPENVVIDNAGIRVSDTQFALLGISENDLTQSS